MSFKKYSTCVVLGVACLILSGFTMGGFRTPDSVLPDPATGHLFVSNINGSPTSADGNGFISLLDTTGKPINMHFIRSGQGSVHLNAPKGMALMGGDLYVADLRQIHRFDRTTGALKGTVDLGLIGAKNLSGLTPGPDGMLFAADPATSTVFTINTLNSHQAAVHLRDRELGKPTALLYDPTHNRLLVASWDHGRLFFIDSGRRVFALMKQKFNRLKSLQFDRQGDLIFSSFVSGKIYRLKKYQTLEVVKENLVTPGNFALDKEGRRLVVPSFRGNIVFSAPLPY